MIAIFVVTIGDIVGLCFLALLLIAGVAIWLMDTYDRRKLRKWQERNKTTTNKPRKET